MYRYGEQSRRRIETCAEPLQDVLEALIGVMDVTVLEGHRARMQQDLAFAQGRSKTPWPHSRHNLYPSQAVDIAPYYSETPHIRWPSNAIMRNADAQVFARYAYMIGLARGIALSKGIQLRSGMDWDSDGEIADNSFMDLPHLELPK